MELDDAQLLRVRDELLAAQAGPPPSAARIWRRSIIAAVGLALAGTGCFWLLLSWFESRLIPTLRGSSEWESGVWSTLGMTILVGGCVFSAGLFCWRRFAIRGNKSDGVLAGALSAVVSHFLIPTALLVCVAFDNREPIHVLKLVEASFLFSLMSLLSFGWITIPVGAVVGWVIAYHQGGDRASP